MNNTLARAGGGDSYTSSGSSGSSSSSSGYSSGSSSSSGSSGSGSYTDIGGFGGLIFLFVIAMIILAVAKKAGKLGKLKGNIDSNKLSTNPIGELIEAGIETALDLPGSNDSIINAKADAVGVHAKLDQIKVTDPGFNEQIFKDKAQNAFYKIQEAWEKQDMRIARPFVSESIMQRYTTQINDIKSRGEKNVLENIVIGNMEVSDVNNDTAFNYIKVQVNASCADYTLDNQGKMIRGSKTPSGFTEYWTFIRTVGSLTNNDKQLKDNKCPNCGAPLEVNATGQCNYCSAVVSSGQYDWVLSQIDQA